MNISNISCGSKQTAFKASEFSVQTINNKTLARVRFSPLQAKGASWMKWISDLISLIWTKISSFFCCRSNAHKEIESKTEAVQSSIPLKVNPKKEESNPPSSKIESSKVEKGTSILNKVIEDPVNLSIPKIKSTTVDKRPSSSAEPLNLSSPKKESTAGERRPSILKPVVHIVEPLNFPIKDENTTGEKRPPFVKKVSFREGLVASSTPNNETAKGERRPSILKKTVHPIETVSTTIEEENLDDEMMARHYRESSLPTPKLSPKTKSQDLLKLFMTDFSAFTEQFFALTESELDEFSKKCARDPNFAPVVRTIKAYFHPKNNAIRGELFNVFCVFFGIKPAFQFSRVSAGNMPSNVMTPLIAMNPSCKEIMKDDGFRYFSNEKPLPFFHPKKYIRDFDKHYPTISDAVLDGFRGNDNRDCLDQVLSYVLGYGPCWEAFATRWSHKDTLGGPMFVPGKKAPLVFTDEHFYQVGEAILHTQTKPGKKRTFSKEECVQTGKEYSETFMERMSTTEGRNFTIDTTMEKLHMEFVIDEISRYTEYFRMNVAYRKRILNFMKKVVNRIAPQDLTP